jgi:hypothetical protein
MINKQEYKEAMIKLNRIAEEYWGKLSQQEFESVWDKLDLNKFYRE